MTTNYCATRCVLLISMLACSCAFAQQPDDAAAPFKVTTQGGGAEVQVKKDTTTIVEVRSRSGIGRATLARKGATWPMSMKIRLYLKGLESFRATAGKQGVGLFVPSSKPTTSHVHLFTNKREGPALKKGNPLWVDVRIRAKRQKIPLTEGYFELSIPAALFRDNPPELLIQWVDFYRN